MQGAAGEARGLSGDLLARRAGEQDEPGVERGRLDPPHRQFRQPAPAGPGGLVARRSGALQHRLKRTGVGVSQVDQRASRAPGHGRRDPGLEAQLAGGRHAAGSRAIVSTPARPRPPRARRPAAIHRRGPRVRRTARRTRSGGARSRRSRSTAAAAKPLGLQHRALLDMELEVAPSPAAASETSSPRSSSTPVVGQGVGDRPPSRSARLASSPGCELPGERGAAEEAAAEPRALLVGPVDQRERRGGSRPLSPRRA